MNALVFVVSFAALGPGQGPATIDPGMTQAQVVAKLGEPLSTRSYDGHTYLLYKNGCERSCGMSDLVVLDSDKVVDAIFRSRARKYSGTSSSPRMISASEARRGPEKAEPPMKIAKPAKPDAEKPAAKPAVQPAAVQPNAAPAKPAPMPQVIRPAVKPDTSKKAAPAPAPAPVKKPTS